MEEKKKKKKEKKTNEWVRGWRGNERWGEGARLEKGRRRGGVRMRESEGERKITFHS